MRGKYSLRRFLLTEEAVHQDAVAKANEIEGKKELHVFDFDDTIAVTPNANGIMPLRNGRPIFHVQEDRAKFEKFLKDYYGLTEADLAPPGEGEEAIQWNEEQGSWTAYILSHALEKVQSKHPKIPRPDLGEDAVDRNQFVWGWDKFDPPNLDTINQRHPDKPSGDDGFDFDNVSVYDGDDTMQVGIDFSPSNATSPDVEAVPDTIKRMKDVKAAGANMKIMTARGGEGKMYARFSSSKKVPVSNADDMLGYAKKKGAEPNLGAMGVWGGDKGVEIQKLIDDLPEDEKPTEIHFYDDQSRNIENVRNALGDDPDNDLFLYGPGNFHHNDANAMVPKEYHPGENVNPTDEASEDLQQLTIERWARIAGIK